MAASITQIISYSDTYNKLLISASPKEETYSSIMRDLVKNKDEGIIDDFRSAFKNSFDKAYLNGEEHPEEQALEEAKQILNKKADKFNDMIRKTAAAINLGSPDEAGQHLAELVRFMLQRISPDRRPKSIQSMKRKIYYINEYAIASKKIPPAASMGGAITILKTLLLEHNPEYIRGVLNSIVKYL